MAVWALVGASIDRFLCSSHSVNYRRLSTSRIAKRFVMGIFILFVLLFVETIYCFEASVPNVPVACYGHDLPCRIFNDWIALIIDIILPSIFLSIFGALTIRNARLRVVRPAINLIGPSVTNTHRLLTRNNDRNLTRMLSIQVYFICFS